MSMEKQAARPAEAEPHTLILEQRSSLTVTGVRRVIRCDPDSAALETGDCVLNLSGAQLSVTALDLDRGEARLSGGSMRWNTPRPGPQAAFCAA